MTVNQKTYLDECTNIQSSDASALFSNSDAQGRELAQAKD